MPPILSLINSKFLRKLDLPLHTAGQWNSHSVTVTVETKNESDFLDLKVIFLNTSFRHFKMYSSKLN